VAAFIHRPAINAIQNKQERPNDINIVPDLEWLSLRRCSR
jgi:hypothetical protein